MADATAEGRIATGKAFVGRQDELARFVVFLGTLPPGWWHWFRRRRSRQSDASGAAGMVSRVVLVHGLGGSGKSRLLRQFRQMASGVSPGSPVSRRVRTVWLDWEDEQRDKPGSYAGAAGPSLVTVLNAVQNAIIGAFATNRRTADRVDKAFSEYRQGAATMPEYAARFASVLAESRQGGPAFTSGDLAAMAKLALATVPVIAGHPMGLATLTPDVLSASATAAGDLSKTVLQAVTGKKPVELSGAEYNLVTDPEDELIRRMAAALRIVAARFGLVIFLDTGEVIGDRGWSWLRRIMKETGPQVIWVVGARFRTEAESGFSSPLVQFGRDIGDARLALMSPSRFDNLMICDYLQSSAYSDTQIDTIARFTRGLPLAVTLAAKLLEGGQDVRDVCSEVTDGHPSKIISALARRYLAHAEQPSHAADDLRQEDVSKILGLALAYGDLRNDPPMLKALWNVHDPLVAFEDLAERHDFVLPVSCQLHDDVRDALRTDLLEPLRRDRVRDINRRALDLFSERLAEMRNRWPTLDEQAAHTQFSTALLGQLWHQLWLDNQAGLELFTETLPVLAVTVPAAADAAADVVDRFAETFDQYQRHYLDLYTEIQPDSLAAGFLTGQQGTVARPTRRVRLTAAGLTVQQRPVFPAAADPVIGQAADRPVTVLILEAQFKAEAGDDAAAIADLRDAASATKSVRLKQVIGSQADAIASRLLPAGQGSSREPSRVGQEAAALATQMLPAAPGVPWRSHQALSSRRFDSGRPG
jgi:hypothetical protein